MSAPGRPGSPPFPSRSAADSRFMFDGAFRGASRAGAVRLDLPGRRGRTRRARQGRPAHLSRRRLFRRPRTWFWPSRCWRLPPGRHTLAARSPEAPTESAPGRLFWRLTCLPGGSQIGAARHGPGRSPTTAGSARPSPSRLGLPRPVAEPGRRAGRRRRPSSTSRSREWRSANEGRLLDPRGGRLSRRLPAARRRQRRRRRRRTPSSSCVGLGPDRGPALAAGLQPAPRGAGAALDRRRPARWSGCSAWSRFPAGLWIEPAASRRGDRGLPADRDGAAVAFRLAGAVLDPRTRCFTCCPRRRCSCSCSGCPTRTGGCFRRCCSRSPESRWCSAPSS